MIHIGNQTAFSAASLLDPFEFALANGFDAFEWFPDKKADGAGWDEADLNLAQRSQIRERARAAGMRLSVHARWQANPLDPTAFPLLLKDIELARDLGAVLLNLHLYAEQGIAAYVQAILPLVRLTADAELELSIENTPHHAPDDFNRLFAQLRAAASSLPLSHVGMCLDLGHANLSAATRNDYLKFIDLLDPQVPINHLHLHENWGDADTHLTVFTGPSAENDSGIRGLLDRLRRRRFAGSMILEQWPQPPELLNQARNRLLELMGNKAQGPKPNPQGMPRDQAPTGE
jgi:sugar phosphate isomerase/epimerase